MCSIMMRVTITKALTEGNVVGLKLLLDVRLRLREEDRAEALTRGRVGAVVHAGDAGAEGCV